MNIKKTITASLATILLASVGAGVNNVSAHGASLGLDQWAAPWERRAGITHWGAFPKSVRYVHGMPKINYHAKTFRKGHHTYKVRDTFNTPGEIIGMDGNTHVSNYKVLHALEGRHVHDYYIKNDMVLTRYHARRYHTIRRHAVKRHRAEKHIRRHARRRSRVIVPARYQHNYYGRAKNNRLEYRLRGNYAYFTDGAKSHNKHWIKYRLVRGHHGKILTINNNYMPNPFKLVGNHIRVMYDTTPVNLYR